MEYAATGKTFKLRLGGIICKTKNVILASLPYGGVTFIRILFGRLYVSFSHLVVHFSYSPLSHPTPICQIPHISLLVSCIRSFLEVMSPSATFHVKRIFLRTRHRWMSKDSCSKIPFNAQSYLKMHVPYH